MTEAKASLKCCSPQGIPTMVQQRIRPNVTCVSAISHQPNNIQRILNTTCMQQASLPVGTRSWPKGQRANSPILKSCTPKGIPTIVRHIYSPEIQYRMAVSSPPKISQTRLPRNFIKTRNLHCKGSDNFPNMVKWTEQSCTFCKFFAHALAYVRKK